ncbi:hypothetical protein HJC23_007508 [Cyclotella cryptica]|uniref:Uncharacterized protein n=1 Tax=Cyclotella cryptica TaxID=29204 RepID=A0ABD3PVF8_9STRA
MIHSAVSTLPQPINPHTPSNKASDGREPTQTHSNASKKDIDGENATASTLFAIEEGSGSRPQSESRRVASRVKRIAPAPTTKFHWEGAGSSFTSVGSSFVSAASQSSVYQYVDDDIGNVEEEEKSSAETVRARRRPNHSIRNSFRRSIHDTLLDDNERTAFTTTLTKSEFLAEIMNGFLDDVPDKSSDGHLAS